MQPARFFAGNRCGFLNFGVDIAALAAVVAWSAQRQQAAEAGADVGLGHGSQEAANPGTGAAHEALELNRAGMRQRLIPAKAQQEIGDALHEQQFPFRGVVTIEAGILDPEQHLGFRHADRCGAISARGEDHPATYTSRAAEKLRRQQSAASIISVFVVPKENSHTEYFSHGPTVSSYITLPVATSSTNELIKPAVKLVDQLYEQGRIYKKAGVMLSGLVPDISIQGNLFLPGNKNCERKLMDMIDNINFSQRDDVLKFAASGTKKDWKMRQELRSGRYTTRWEELFEVK